MAIRTDNPNPSGVSTQSYADVSPGKTGAPCQKDISAKDNELPLSEPSASVTTSNLESAHKGLGKIAAHNGKQGFLSKFFNNNALSSSSTNNAGEPGAHDIATDEGVARLLADAGIISVKATSNRAGELDLRALSNEEFMASFAKLSDDLDSIG